MICEKNRKLTHPSSGPFVRLLMLLAGGWLVSCGPPSGSGVTGVVTGCPAGAPKALARGKNGVSFVRGDTNAGGKLDLSDAVRIFGYLFLGNPETLDCHDAADADDTGALELVDGISVFNYLFSGGAAPPAPGPIECGLDATADDALDCVSFPPCGS